MSAWDYLAALYPSRYWIVGAGLVAAFAAMLVVHARPRLYDGVLVVETASGEVAAHLTAYRNLGLGPVRASREGNFVTLTVVADREDLAKNVLLDAVARLRATLADTPAIAERTPAGLTAAQLRTVRIAAGPTAIPRPRPLWPAPSAALGGVLLAAACVFVRRSFVEWRAEAAR